MVVDGEVLVSRLVEMMEPIGVALVSPSAGGDALVRSTYLYDGNLPSTPGHLVLALMMAPDDAMLVELCLAAAKSGQPAMAIKARGRSLDPAVQAANLAGVALMVVPDAVAWADVHSAASAALRPADTERADLAEDLFALADSIAGVFGSSVAIEDLSQNVVGYSALPGQLIDEVRIAGILGRRVPPSAATASQYQQVYAAEGIIRFPLLNGEQPRAAIAIRAGALALGSIWALEERGIEQGTDLTDEQRSALERGAQLAARHLMRAHDAGEPAARQRRAIFDALLAGRPVSRRDLALLADADILTVTVIAQVNAGHSAVEVARLVSRQYRALRPRSVISQGYEAVYVLSPGDDTGTARRMARDILTTVESSLGPGLCAAVSETCTTPAALPAARAEADAIMRCLRSEGECSRVADTAEVRALMLLLNCADRLGDEGRLWHPGVTAMCTQESGRERPFRQTILAWLASGCSVPAAARGLHVHENTVRYRLSRVRRLFDIDLDDPDTRLAIWLQLRAAALTERTTGPTLSPPAA